MSLVPRQRTAVHQAMDYLEGTLLGLVVQISMRMVSLSEDGLVKHQTAYVSSCVITFKSQL